MTDAQTAVSGSKNYKFKVRYPKSLPAEKTFRQNAIERSTIFQLRRRQAHKRFLRHMHQAWKVGIYNILLHRRSLQFER
jgi:hypothetical protein